MDTTSCRQVSLERPEIKLSIEGNKSCLEFAPAWIRGIQFSPIRFPVNLSM